MFCYNLGIVDHFLGMHDLQDYINPIIHSESRLAGQIIGVNTELNDLRSDLEKAITALYNSDSDWEGDIRNQGCLMVGGLPYECGDPTMMHYFMFKQDNNGTTFLVSPVHLPWVQEGMAIPTEKTSYNESKRHVEIVDNLFKQFIWKRHEEPELKEKINLKG